MPTFHDIDVLRHNSASRDTQAARDCEWSRPVGAEEVAAARRGDWAVKLTPGALPAHWLGDVRGREILCLGGQQAPILAAAGARVTLFDASAGQLDKDRLVAARERLELSCVQGDMRDLSTFADASFDLVFNPSPISTSTMSCRSGANARGCCGQAASCWRASTTRRCSSRTARRNWQSRA